MKVDWFLDQVRHYKLLEKNSAPEVLYNDTGLDLSPSTSEISERPGLLGTPYRSLDGRSASVWPCHYSIKKGKDR
jgi:hypothetical protein